ncbi:N-acetylmuramoyl-L-alanine amidase [Bacillus sp. ISL-47]|uniref:N-acetylmuramoyl-L-alanine amidase n=1 Tax=Bacillus sp. ISL-47 TaxID=2819130 RepID=UPI001BEB6467|nr:N-acetylmuramoyl-L-alanine amidase [Bacillus sp. ISL-47]MBT2689205.1 N-acetylmuramoyl-L-alanine amidase [Bacillus sp. ISL-47]MBT2708674.1 N-acetylmuramoyl-L-alanine amidase [Pseudomonas sp. ISL-84]
MYKRIFLGVTILVAACVMVISMGGTGLAAYLKDIPSKYSSEINYLVDRNIVTGYPNQTFRPELDVTREEAATMIGRALKLDGTKRSTSFPDVKADSYASGYIQSAVEANILTGYEDDTFKPKEKITRGEMAYLLKRAFNLSATSNVFFSDVAKSGAQYNAINAVVTAGIANGYPTGSYKPLNPINRMEFSLLVARAVNPTFRVSSAELVPKETMVVTADSLNVRSGPGTEFSVIGALPLGTKVTTYYSHGDWVYASSGSLTGFVHSGYLTVPNAKKIIAIDPGHGGSDPGAIANGIYEKELNLSVGLKVRKILEDKGIQVVMTRTNDTFVSLQGRIDYAVKAKADSFVSIHGNANTSSSPNGTETYYSTAALNTRAENSKKLAGFIQERLHKALGTNDRGIKEAGFHVINKNPLPSVLVELGFLTNAGDAQKLSSDYYRNKAAEAIALGIVDYYNWKN